MLILLSINLVKLRTTQNPLYFRMEYFTSVNNITTYVLSKNTSNFNRMNNEWFSTSPFLSTVCFICQLRLLMSYHDAEIHAGTSTETRKCKTVSSNSMEETYCESVTFKASCTKFNSSGWRYETAGLRSCFAAKKKKKVAFTMIEVTLWFA